MKYAYCLHFTVVIQTEVGNAVVKIDALMYDICMYMYGI